MHHRHHPELQFEIMDTVACTGTCAGCAILDDEREYQAMTVMSGKVRQRYLSRIEEYARGFGDYHRLAVMYSVGDHLLLGADAVIEAYGDTVEVFRRLGPSAGSAPDAVFVTMSMVGREAKIAPMIRQISRAQEDGYPIVPVVVFDPKRLATKLSNEYLRLIETTMAAFGRVDLTINVSAESIRHITPNRLFEFAYQSGFDEVVINWQVTDDNVESTWGDAQTAHEIASWLAEYERIVATRGDGRLQSAYADTIREAIRMMTPGSGLPMAHQVRDTLANTVNRAMLIDGFGNLYPKLEAVGDIPQAYPYGFSPLGNIETSTIDELVSLARRAVPRRAMKSVSRPACLQCPYQGVCAVTGFHVTSDVVHRKDGTAFLGPDCPHGARTFIEALDDMSADTRRVG